MDKMNLRTPKVTMTVDQPRPRGERRPGIAARLLHGCCTNETRRADRAPSEFEIGSGAGIRTLNLAVNSRLLYR